MPKIETPFRAEYEGRRLIENLLHLPPSESRKFISFLRKTRHIFTEISKAGGDAAYVLDVLSFVRYEEIGTGDGRHFVNKWDVKPFRAIPVSETVFEVKKFRNGKWGRTDIKDIPDFLRQKLKEMEEHALKIRANPFDLKGEVNTTYNVDISYNGERYRLSSAHTMFLHTHAISHELDKKGRGRKGEPHSNLAMYLLYKYFKHHLKFKKIYQPISTLINEYSSRFFRDGRGYSLDPDHVRKRIQWVNSKKIIKDYAAQYERLKLNSRR